MRQLYLKVTSEAAKLQRCIDTVNGYVNALKDQHKGAKKLKQDEIATELGRQITNHEQSLIDMRFKMHQLEHEFDRQKRKCGELRVDLAVFADVLQNTLVDYREFLQKYVENGTADAHTYENLELALKCVRAIVYEMADDKKTNELYSHVTDRFISKWQMLRDGVIDELEAASKEII